MGKTSKRKMKWRSLEMDKEPQNSEDQSTQKPPNEVHPFLKIISKNMDAIVKKDHSSASDDSKLVYLYRSDKTVGVSDQQDLTQFAGKPIQYKPVQQVQGNGTLHSAGQQQQQVFYQSYPPYTPPINTNPTPSHSQDIFIPHIPGQATQGPQHVTYPMYCSPYPPNQPFQYPTVQQIPQYQHPGHPPDHPHSPHHPQVEYVPYYYYYPVPAHNPTQPEYHSSISTETQAPLAKQIHTGSTTSCDSCFGEDKVIRRRKKKKKSVADFKDVDSGYFNGAESSSELNSEEELQVVKKTESDIKLVGKEDPKSEGNKETEKEITNLLIKQIQNPTIDFQFGEVQEILDELNRTRPAVTEEHTLPQVEEEEVHDNLTLIKSDFDSNLSVSSEAISNTEETILSHAQVKEETLTKDETVPKFDSLNIAKQEKKPCEGSSLDSSVNSYTNKNRILETEFTHSQIKEEENVIISKGTKKKKNKKKKILSETLTQPKETLISELKEPILDLKSCALTERWTTVSNSRKNKNSSQKTWEEEKCYAFHDTEDQPKTELKETLYIKHEETETNYESDPSKEICSVIDEDTVENIKSPTMNNSTKSRGKKAKQKKKSKSQENDNLTKDKDIASMISDLDNKSKNIIKPLEEMKELFYQEKTVEIVNLQSEDSNKKRPARIQKNKNRARLQKSQKAMEIQDQVENNNENLMAELIDMNFPILFFHPFMNFEDQLLQDHSSQIDHVNTSRTSVLKDSNKNEMIPFNSHSMTFLDPSVSPHMISDYSHLIVGGSTGLYTKKTNIDEDLPRENLEQLEEHLVEMNVLPSQHNHGYLKNGKNRVVMLRPQNPYGETKSKPNRKSAAKKIEVPGPRLKYSPVLRSGPLGVRRQVVPPMCLASRFTRI